MSTFNEANEIASYAVFGVGYQGDPDSPRPEGTPLKGTVVLETWKKIEIKLDGKIASHDTWAELAGQIQGLLLDSYYIAHDLSTAVTGRKQEEEYPEMELQEEQ